ncbi:SO_0444 family Cu/Zn efflux transporter [Vibrio sp. S11_S32]|uniref:SO_0444 family Cu/Zn efflux transporter n=1 Tax=Vibrio sp. S11_S32 TaxID=2720225 RepID=UPI00168103A6|nr:SO_0444 family Cu/Zn efflux transporter [Vibrio sp. S11_S32]MBD1575171.1 SO_0444 family Cu/Zn efflux transporter [Vibrio sp. S11_S32]
MNFLSHFVELFLESAPWLLLGLITAGIIKVFIPSTWLNRQLGGSGFKAIVKSAIFGAPLPLCSCGVIPAAVGLRRAGASKASTTSFLVSTPETGVDSIAISYVLLGPFMAIMRPISAIFSAILAGILVGRDEKKITVSSISSPSKLTPASSCCSNAETTILKPDSAMLKPNGILKIKPSCCSNKKTTSCGSSSDSDTEKPNTLIGKIKLSLTFASTDLLKDTSGWLLVGLGFAALIQAYMPDGFLEGWGSGILAMLLMVLISIPMYICATASTPVAAGLLLAGISPGAVLVFMLAGPASNVASLGIVAKEMGKRALFGYLGGVLGGALIMGSFVDYLVTQYGFQVTPQIGPEHELLPHWLTISCGGILAILIIFNWSKDIFINKQQAHS